MSANGLVRIHYLGGFQCAEVYRDIAASLIASGIAEEVKEEGVEATPVTPIVHTATAPVTHRQQAAVMPRPGFVRGPISNVRRTATAGR